jgi:hypothetical protein
MLKHIHSFLFGSRICSGCRQNRAASSALCRACYARMSAFLSGRKKGRSRPVLEAAQSCRNREPDHSPLGFQESRQVSISDVP